jgi:hypothetical protein
MPEDVSPKEAPVGLPPASPSAAAPLPTLLDQAEAAHRVGHFAQVRALLKQLSAERGLSDADQKRLEALAARLRPDPLAAILLVACLLLFALVIARYWN